MRTIEQRIERINSYINTLRTHHPEAYEAFLAETEKVSSLISLFRKFSGGKSRGLPSANTLANLSAKYPRAAKEFAGLAEEVRAIEFGNGGLARTTIEVISLPKSPRGGAQTIIQEVVKVLQKDP